MKTITKTIHLYRFSELKENIKNKVKEVLRDKIIEDNFYFFEDDANYILKEKYGIENAHLSYSLSYCQGDGVSFTLNNILSYTRLTSGNNLNAFEKWLLQDKTFFNKEDKALIIQYLNEDYNLSIKRRNYNYSYAETCFIDYEMYYGDDEDKIENVINRLCKALFQNVYLKICNELEKAGYQNYEVSDEDIEENCKENDYWFNENGGIEE